MIESTKLAVQNTNQSSSNRAVNAGDDRNNGLLGSALSNILVIVGFAMFAYTVKCVLRTIVE